MFAISELRLTFSLTSMASCQTKREQERPRAPVVKLSCLQEHVHKKKVLEIVSHPSKYNMFKARNSCIVPGSFSMPLVVLSIGTHVTLAKLYKLADTHVCQVPRKFPEIPKKI